jgi:branched-chain amino acid transport system substrate-binding protein
VVEFGALSEFFGNEPPKRVAIVESRTEVAKEFGNAYKAHIQKEGYYKIVVDEIYPLGATDFSMIISKAKAADAEGFLSCPTPPEGMAMVRQMKELNYCPKFMDLSQAASSRGWPGGSGEIGEYVTTVTGWNHTLTWPGNKELVEESKKKAGGKLPWSDVGHSYMAAQVLADAIERAGTLDRDKIRDALATSEMMTVGGPVKARSDGTFEVITYLSQWQKGQLVAVAPKEHTSFAYTPIPKWDKR